MPLTLIFVRHGESTANVDRVFANRVNIPGDLTPTGIGQAEALASSHEGAGLTHIYASPLPRAVQTARIVASRSGLPVTTTDALREYDVGEDEGFPYSGLDAWRWDRYQAVQRAWRDGNHAARHPGGESLDDLQRRLGRFMADLATNHGDHDVVLAVGHGGLLHAALPSLLPYLPADIATRHPLGHGDRVEVRLGQGEWRCLHWGSFVIGERGRR